MRKPWEEGYVKPHRVESLSLFFSGVEPALIQVWKYSEQLFHFVNGKILLVIRGGVLLFTGSLVISPS